MKSPRVFISYSQEDGLSFAEYLHAYLLGIGLDSWLYDSNLTIGAPTFREITTEIRDRDIAIVIITRESHSSIGQEKECNSINYYNKPAYLLKATDTAILPELSWANWSEFTNRNFHELCERLPIELNRTIQQHRKRERQRANIHKSNSTMKGNVKI